MKIGKYLLPLVAILIFGLTDSFAKYDQANIERMIKENMRFIDFLDTCVTNFAMDKKNDLFTIYQKHFNGEIAYLQGQYKRAFDEIYSSQKDMVALYELILTEFYLEDSKNMLDGHAADIIKSKNTMARQYLSLGYRDRAVSRNLYVSGEASHPRLRSYKISKYIDGINLARRAKRYTFISLYTSQDGKTKLRIYNEMFKKENENGGVFFKRFIDKDEKAYIAEMNKTYEEYLSETENSQSGANDTDNDASNLTAFEKKSERRARFRHEQRVARYILNEEFYKAETIIRSYVDNYNFKLIMATLNVLSDGAHEGESDSETVKDYKKYINHHNDNYLILNIPKGEKSALESVAGDVKIKDPDKKGDQNNDDIQQIEVNSSTSD